ncbi:FAD:protein fmn transferase [Plakobranchus ocellatus]|uniref:FAD:protein FMN transferase n=1 Tax=Plakobranchus ocellatus TaxID=259542 RepID=A0AAV4B3D7_9GAST|nr:FAD:protein fmn transferase [Plakobranchus ocellatus]
MQTSLTSAFSLSKFTEGKFDPTVYPLVALWGFYNQEGNVPNAEEIAEAKQAVGYQKVIMDNATIYLQENMKIDLSAIAKGKAVDLVKEILDQEGVENYLIEIGGEIRVQGRNKNNQKWQIYIISPDRGSSLGSLIVALDNVAIATSGDYLNYFEEKGKKYSHIIDPTTGAPVTHNLASVSVVSEKCEEADALATALLVMGKKAGEAFAEKNNLATYFIYQEGDGFVGLASSAFKKYIGAKK